MIELQTASSVPATLIMRFRQATCLPVLLSKQVLEQFPPDERIQYVEMAELNGGRLHDPIEDEPTFQELFKSIRQEANLEVEQWYQEEIAELEQQSPTVAKLFHNRRWLLHRYWDTVQRLFWERHQIKWQTPAQMNP